MCLGQKSGIEHAIPAFGRRFLEDRTERILLIDARIAFNSLNRDLALKNIRKLCPSIYTAIRKLYKTPSDLFIDKSVIKSQEGTTQGDPIAMAMYGDATLPLTDMLEDQNWLINGTQMTVMWPVALNHCESCWISSLNMALHSVIMWSDFISLQNFFFRRRTKFFRD